MKGERKLICANCRGVRVLSIQEQDAIRAELSAQKIAARKILDCSCGRGQWAIALADLQRGASCG